MKKILCRMYKCMLVAALIATSITVGHVSVNAAEKVNLALKGTATASHQDSAAHAPSKAIDGDTSNDSRWGAEPYGTNQWLKVDLQKKCEFDVFNIYAENVSAQKIKKFKIEGSNDDSSWEMIHNSLEKPEGYDLKHTVNLPKAVSYRYVKITVESLIDNAYPSVSLREFEIMGYEKGASTTPENVNLASGKEVTASAQYSSMPASNLTDDDKNSRWSTESAPTQWAYVDLGKSQDMNKFEMVWESADCYASAYNIYVSNDKANWGTAVVSKTDNTAATSVEVLKTPVTGRYVKLEVTQQHGYPSVSCRDFTVMLTDGEAPQDPSENVALNQNAVASSSEDSNFVAAKAFDGDTTSKTSRWASNVGNAPHWIYCRLRCCKECKDC